jgi:hypothetical protein
LINAFFVGNSNAGETGVFKVVVEAAIEALEVFGIVDASVDKFLVCAMALVWILSGAKGKKEADRFYTVFSMRFATKHCEHLAVIRIGFGSNKPEECFVGAGGFGLTDVRKIGQHMGEVFVGLRDIRNGLHEGDKGELALMWILFHR